MYIWQQYLLKSFMKIFMALLAVLICFDLLLYFVNELKFVGRGSYTLIDAACYVLLSMPRKIYDLSSWITLLTTIILLVQLTKKSELIILKTAGISKIKLATTLLTGFSVVLLVLVFLGEGVAPIAENTATKIRNKSISKGNVIATKDGIWVKHQDAFVLINQVGENILQDIIKFQVNETFNLTKIAMIKSATEMDSLWHLNEILEINDINTQPKSKVIDKSTKANFLPKFLPITTDKQLLRKSITELMLLKQQYKTTTQNMKPLQIALLVKINKVFIIIIMLLLGIAFSSIAPRKDNMAVNILIGVLLSFSVHIISSVSISYAAILSLNPILLIFTPTIILLGVALLRLNKY